MNCKKTVYQPEDCEFWDGTHKCCVDPEEYVEKETGDAMCRYNSSAVHVTEYGNN